MDNAMTFEENGTAFESRNAEGSDDLNFEKRAYHFFRLKKSERCLRIPDSVKQMILRYVVAHGIRSTITECLALTTVNKYLYLFDDGCSSSPSFSSIQLNCLDIRIEDSDFDIG
ncbi:unnamed protein product [Schistosoma curassoni]|uniref:F-box domain-containing protein n=1 Tax=Schistosoma curassoni TaxID=6186 RepID=A0A183JMC4_9TREM|nr:unnamed protein product [Schistosoma curassoni]